MAEQGYGLDRLIEESLNHLAAREGGHRSPHFIQIQVSQGVGYAGYARINAAPCEPTNDKQLSFA